MPARDLPPLPPRDTRRGVYARRVLIEDPDLDHESWVGVPMRPVDTRLWAPDDTVATIEDTTDLDHDKPLPDLADRTRIAIAPRWPDGFGPTDEQTAAILAAGQQ